jgi:DNA-binding NarL/FixJ family response regulator
VKRKNIQILLVDDHQVVRDGLQRMLEQEEDIHVVGDCACAEDALLLAGIVSPDIILTDIKMPGTDGIELTRQLKRKHPSCNVIMLTLYDQYLTQAMEAGAKGYLLKDIKCEELAEAIRQVHRGQVVTSGSIKPKTQSEYEDRGGKKAEEDPDSMIEEIQLVLPPPIEANQLMKLSGRVEEVLQSRVLQMIGAWQEGTVMTIVLNRVRALEDILNTFKNMPEVKTVGEEPLSDDISRTLLKKAESIPRPKNRTSKTIFLTLGKN